MEKTKVLMIGPDRNVKGGISSLVNNYFKLGLVKDIDLDYLPTSVDGSKLKKLIVAIFSYIKFCFINKKYNIIHVHMASDTSFVRKSIFIKKAHKLKKKIIIHQHGGNIDDYYFSGSKKRQKKIKKIFSYADIVIVLSSSLENFFKENVCRNTKVIKLFNGVVVPSYEPKNCDNHNLLFLGRLVKEKGIYELLDAINIVKNHYQDVLLYIGGTGENQRCHNLIDKYNLNENVKMLGWLNEENKNKYLNKCSVFVLPTHFEGMPISVLEAMSNGLVVLASNVGGIPEIIKDNVNGFLVEPHNSDLLANKIIEIFENKEKAIIAKNGYETVLNNFNLEKDFLKIISIYKNL